MIEIRPDNTLLARIPELRRADTNALVEAGVSVSVSLYDTRTGDPITAGGSPIFPLALDHEGDGEYAALIPSTLDVERNDRVNVKFEAAGGPYLTGTWWYRDQRVLTRKGP